MLVVMGVCNLTGERRYLKLKALRVGKYIAPKMEATLAAKCILEDLFFLVY